MRVLHVIHSLRPEMGGLPRAALSLAAAQAALGAEVALAAYDTHGDGPEYPRAFGDIPGANRVRWIRMSAPGLREYFTAAGMRARMQRFQPDVVHTHGLWEPLLRHAHAQALRMGAPHVVCPHSMLNPWQSRHRRVAKFLLTRLMDWERLWHRAVFVHALSDAEAERLRKRGMERVRVFPNGVFPETFPGKQAASSESILFLGRLDRVKRPDLLLEAFAMLAARRKEARLVLAGPDYGLRGTLQHRVRAAGLGGRVLFPGMLTGESRRDALRNSTCFCLPSESEGCSLAVLEAAAAGVPLVLSESCDLGDWFDAGAALKAPAAPGALAEVLEALLDTPSTRKSLARAAGEKVRRTHAWPDIAADLLEAYK